MEEINRMLQLIKSFPGEFDALRNDSNYKIYKKRNLLLEKYTNEEKKSKLHFLNLMHRLLTR